MLSLGGFYVLNVSPKLLSAFLKAAPNHKGYMDVPQKTLKKYYGKGVDVHSLIGKLPRREVDFARPQLHRSVQPTSTSSLNTTPRQGNPKYILKKRAGRQMRWQCKTMSITAAAVSANKSMEKSKKSASTWPTARWSRLWTPSGGRKGSGSTLWPATQSPQNTSLVWAIRSDTESPENLLELSKMVRLPRAPCCLQSRFFCGVFLPFHCRYKPFSKKVSNS